MRFILVDRILEIENGKRARMIKNVSSSEDYFTHHFPGLPVMPAAMILESMEQGSALFLMTTLNFEKKPALREIRNAKFKRFVRPGDQMILNLDLSWLNENRAQLKGRANIEGRVYAEADLTFDIGEPLLDPRDAKSLYKQLSSKEMGPF